MSNPVFKNIDENLRKGSYASFGQQRQQPQNGQPQYGQYGQASADDLQQMYERPAAGPVSMGRVTVDDVVVKAGVLFGIMLVVAAASWFYSAANPLASAPMLLGGVVVTLVLGLVIAFKKTISVPLIVAYAAFEGLLVGSISQIYATQWHGVVTSAIVATLSVFVAMFAGWKFGIVKVTSRSRRIFSLAIFGYLIFAVANMVAAWAFGANSGWGFFGFGSGMSILVSVFAVGLASYSLAMDFDSIDRAVAAELPQKYSWLLAHGLLVTVVWLYLEMLRLIAQFQGRD